MTIHWKDCDRKYSIRQQAYWRRHFCKWVTREKDGKCIGYDHDDTEEPHPICRACDRNTMFKGDES